MTALTAVTTLKRTRAVRRDLLHTRWSSSAVAGSSQSLLAVLSNESEHAAGTFIIRFVGVGVVVGVVVGVGVRVGGIALSVLEESVAISQFVSEEVGTLFIASGAQDLSLFLSFDSIEFVLLESREPLIDKEDKIIVVLVVVDK